jgi:hypothetical protein
MRRLRTVLSLAALILLISSGVACKQGAGDRCEIDSDCQSGLVCNNGFNKTDPQGGMCGPPLTGTTGIDASAFDTGNGGDVAEEVASDHVTATDGGDVATGDAGDGQAGDAADDAGGDAGGDSAAD